MVKIANNQIITMHRGDTFSVPVYISTGTSIEPEHYVLDQYDTVYFGICEPNMPWEKAIVRKAYTKDDLDANNNINIGLDVKDTEFLLPGEYYYEIKLRRLFNGVEKIDTILSRTSLIILE